MATEQEAYRQGRELARRFLRSAGAEHAARLRLQAARWDVGSMPAARASAVRRALRLLTKATELDQGILDAPEHVGGSRHPRAFVKGFTEQVRKPPRKPKGRKKK